jgi:hypothetical protein
MSNSTGSLNIINASNIIHTNSFGNFPFYLDNEQNIVNTLTISNFSGSNLIDGGRSKILIKKGDAF